MLSDVALEYIERLERLYRPNHETKFQSINFPNRKALMELEEQNYIEIVT